MNSAIGIIGWNLAALMILMLVLWLFSLVKRNPGIVDAFWGIGFVMVAWMTDGYLARSLVLLILTTVWGLRLALHIGKRHWGKGEDRRYQAWRREHGKRFWWVSLFTVFWIQGILLWIISLVVQVGQLSPQPARLTWFDGLGVFIWGVGFGFEAVADLQLARFKTEPGSHEKIMNRGLWAYSRHPNYFGEALVWWGIFCITLSSPGNFWTVISPLTITFLLLKVSGVTLLEKTIVETRPNYRAYMKTTNAFIPWFPKRERL